MNVAALSTTVKQTTDGSASVEKKGKNQCKES